MQAAQLALDFSPTAQKPPNRPPLPKLPGIAKGEKGKSRDIVAAVRTLKQVEREGRKPTLEEGYFLMRFWGFGPVALSLFPDPVTGKYKDASWKEFGTELKELLTPEEYASAKRTTFNAFYTSPTVIQAIHDAIARLGIPADATVLEPGCGTGNFMAHAPKEMRFIGVELDSITGRIAKLLHPNHDIRVESFRDTRLPEGGIDAAIGNVPFSDLKLDYHGQKLSLHDFFFVKSIDALKPGGILAMVTSHFTLDRVNASVREYLGSKADFIRAIRLPSDAFKKEGTSVVTDIVFLRKRGPGEYARHEEAEWQRSTPFEIDGEEISINRYFQRHPDMVLGDWSRQNTLYGDGFSVSSNGDLEEQLDQAVFRLPAFPTIQATPAERPAKPAFTPPPLERHVGEGSFFVAEDKSICQLQDGRAVPVVYGGTSLRADGAMTGKRMAALIDLRDRARRVLLSQNEGWPQADRDQVRRDLNWAYDRFHVTYGPINKTTLSDTKDGGVIRRMPNLVKFRDDPDAMLAMSLEDYNEETGKATKAAIMKQDVVGRTPPVTSVASAEEGLLVSLNQRGGVDLPFIGQLYGKERKDVIAELGDLIYPNPESKAWQTADAYLSGNVRHKLAFALQAGPLYARNVTALRTVQPEDVLPGDIDAGLGAPWIPESDIQAFAAELFKVPPGSVPIGHIKKDAVWSLDAGYDAKQSVAATSEFGTARANGTWLLELALNMKSPTIYDIIQDGGREERVVNLEATMAAREKQKLIKERFRAWIFTDPRAHGALGPYLQRRIQ